MKASIPMTIRHPMACLRTLAVALALVASGLGVQAQGTLRPEVGRPLAAAQEALKGGKAAEALAQAQQLRAVPGLTNLERTWVERVVAAAALEARQDAAALPALEFLGTSADLAPAERLPFLRAQVQVAQQLKDHPRLLAAARAYLAAGGPDPTIRLVLFQVMQVQGQHSELVQAVEALLAPGAGAPPPSERELRLLAASQRHLKDEAGYYRALKHLVTRHPSKDYWIDLLSRVTRQPGFNPRLELDVYRLLEEVGGLDEADDITYMASLAMKAGLPAQALRLLDAGLAAKVLGTGPEAANHQRLRAEAARRAAEDDKGLPALEAAVTDATAQAELAQVLASKQQWDRAVPAFARALAAGGQRREAELRLHQGIALFKAGQPAAARTALQAVQGDASAVELATLWLLRVPAR